jgi:hypothetical protein
MTSLSSCTEALQEDARMGETFKIGERWFVVPSGRYPLRYALPFWDMANVQITEDLDPEQRFEEKEQARRADVEALRSGEKTAEQLNRENTFLGFPPERMRINLDASGSLS